ncbi:unnamed protein product [Adineta steineri]|uniref:Uncharacterized protein n=1 Tax=Adineta steineri TaxID=433720 RepID=A0A818T8A6_9BILA|nr:unnamed protein product [Adineta steineri]CAF0805624.1 unnamed protein product [Adineta steineri]CAF0897985.1 unnamed protein product [Adineta steineri]CAF3569266.1 unnamed protein product [Adineta steineri]CAF3635826.1 unnamed protein product [Adineta steineri]
MNSDNKLLQNIQNISTTTTIVNSYLTHTTQSSNDNDMKHILSYAIPIACVAIGIVLLIVIGIQRRHRVLEKWSSLTRMRNTNPRFIERTGLRRDSEYESYNDGFVNVTIINADGLLQKEPEFRLATIT